jgi:putative flippase GtrA
VASRDAPDSTGVSLAAARFERFASFGTVGVIGFVIDASILSTLVHVVGWPHNTARAVSFAAAVTVTWYLNRRWVFARTHSPAREYGAYFGIQAAGAAINLGTYAVVIAVVPGLVRLPVVPLAAGALLALLFNYSAASRWVFAATPPRARSPQ